MNPSAAFATLLALAPADGRRDAPLIPTPPVVAPITVRCPKVEDLTSEWVEHAGGEPPPEALRQHGDRPLRLAAPLLLAPHGTYHWFGLSRRSFTFDDTSDPGCSVMGSVAYYENGLEPEPTDDIVSVIRSGHEPSLRPRLVELRWFDPADNKRHRWSDPRWAVEGRSPMPAAQAVNTLY